MAEFFFTLALVFGLAALLALVFGLAALLGLGMLISNLLDERRRGRR